MSALPVEPSSLRAAHVQHVWVDPTGVWADPHPGILLAWRRRARGWEAWVVYATQGAPAHGSDPRLAVGWVDAASVRAARALPAERTPQRRSGPFTT